MTQKKNKPYQQLFKPTLAVFSLIIFLIMNVIMGVVWGLHCLAVFYAVLQINPLMLDCPLIPTIWYIHF